MTLPKKPGLGAVLAYFAAAVRPAVRPLKDTETQVFNSLVARRRRMVTMLVSEKSHPVTAISAVQPRIEAHIAWLSWELDDFDAGLRQTPGNSPIWREKDDRCAPFPAWEVRSPSPS